MPACAHACMLQAAVFACYSAMELGPLSRLASPRRLRKISGVVHGLKSGQVGLKHLNILCRHDSVADAPVLIWQHGLHHGARREGLQPLQRPHDGGGHGVACPCSEQDTRFAADGQQVCVCTPMLTSGGAERAWRRQQPAL